MARLKLPVLVTTPEKGRRTTRMFLLSFGMFLILNACKKEEEILLNCTGTETTTIVEPASQRGQETMRIQRSFRFFEATREVTDFDVSLNTGEGIAQSGKPARQRVWIFQEDNAPEVYRNISNLRNDNVGRTYRRVTRSNVTVSETELAVRSLWDSQQQEERNPFENREEYSLNINRINGRFDSQRRTNTRNGDRPFHLLVTASGNCTRLSGRRI